MEWQLPKKIRNPEEIKKIRERTLEVAIKLLAEEGFDKMSMRKIASRLKMTAANIYNYFSSKDDLYLFIQTKGFEFILEQVTKACAGVDAPRMKLEMIISEYINFGIGNPDWYNIIFSMDSPKYADYKDMAIEPIAKLEKQAGLKLLNFTLDIVKEVSQSNNGSIEDIQFRTLQFWTSLHGFVSLHNSRVLQEVDKNTDKYTSWFKQDLMIPFTDKHKL